MQLSSIHLLDFARGLGRGVELIFRPSDLVFLYSTMNLLRRSSVTFNPTSNGQVALVIYEWNDVSYLGVDTPDNSVGGVYRPVRLPHS